MRNSQPRELMAMLKLRGMTQGQFAEKIGFNPNTVSRWLRSAQVAKLSIEEWRKIADSLGVSIDDLYEMWPKTDKVEKTP